MHTLIVVLAVLRVIAGAAFNHRLVEQRKKNKFIILH
jgi:hypothetical protein